jgi:predicted transcriptional regulator
LRRSKSQILSELLAACKTPISEKNLKTTVRLPPELFQKCTSLLLRKKWIEASDVENSGLVHYVTTKKGTVFLEKYLKLQQLLTPEPTPKQLVTVKASKK